MRMIAEESRKWWILIAMGGVGGLIMLDETVVAVALPTMRHDLGMSDVASHWVINAYMLVFSGMAAAGGKIGDIFGFRKLVLVGLGAFGLASLAAGFAGDGAFLITMRALQGVGAAAIFPATIAMVSIAFPKEERGMAIGILAAIGTTFLAIGPMVGGFLTEIVSWHWVFWINAPVVALTAVIVLAAWVAPAREDARAAFDYGGFVSLVAGLGMLIIATMQGAVWGWTQGVILALLVGGIVCLALFVVIERQQAAPLIEVDLFRIAAFSAYSLVFVIGQFSKIAIVVFGALYLQDAIHMRPLSAGLALLVAVAPFPIMSAPVGQLADKFGARRPVLGGLALATLAIFLMGLVMAWDSYLLLLPGLVLWGIGMSCCYAPGMRAMTNAVPTEKQGQASGIGVTARLLGGTVGMAISSTLFVTTRSFQVVFLVCGALMAAVLVLGWLAMPREEGDLTAQPSPPPAAG